MASHDLVWIDRDAAGYGWTPLSRSPDTREGVGVDLLSTLTREFGHFLGFDHDVMGATLGVGQQRLPLLLPDAAIANRDMVFEQFDLSLVLGDPTQLFERRRRTLINIYSVRPNGRRVTGR